MLSEEALKFNTITAFISSNKSAYEAARKRGILSSICTHMTPLKIKWTHALLQAEASKYTVRTDFKRASPGAYKAACSMGKLKEITSHMGYKYGGFNKTEPAILYYFKIGDCWKIGVTGNMLESRYNACDRSRMQNIQVWNFETGEEAYNYEQGIIKMYKEYKYNGTTPFTDGTSITECFSVDIHALDKDV